jgi:hypothetical protein
MRANVLLQEATFALIGPNVTLGRGDFLPFCLIRVLVSILFWYYGLVDLFMT